MRARRGSGGLPVRRWRRRRPRCCLCAPRWFAARRAAPRARRPAAPRAWPTRSGQTSVACTATPAPSRSPATTQEREIGTHSVCVWGGFAPVWTPRRAQSPVTARSRRLAAQRHTRQGMSKCTGTSPPAEPQRASPRETPCRARRATPEQLLRGAKSSGDGARARVRTWSILASSSLAPMARTTQASTPSGPTSSAARSALKGTSWLCRLPHSASSATSRALDSADSSVVPAASSAAGVAAALKPALTHLHAHLMCSSSPRPLLPAADVAASAARRQRRWRAGGEGA